MKYKNIYIILSILIILPMIRADFCINSAQQTIPCTLLTPNMVNSCTDYYYEIYNKTGSLLVNDSMQVYNATVYQFEFNQTTGDYLIKLCDGNNKEISVNAGGLKMWDLGLILIPLIFGIISLVASITISKEHTALKVFLMLTSIIGVISSLYIGSVIVGTGNPEVQTAIGTIMQWVSYFLFVIVIYVLVVLIIWILAYISEKNNKKYQY